MADTKIQRLRLLMEDEPVGSPESQELSTKVLHVPTLTLKDDTTKEIPPSTPDWGTYPAKASPKKKSFPRPRKNRDTSMKEDTQTNPSPVLPTSSSTSVPSVNGLNFGHMSSPNQTFCPVSAVSKFPYKYMRKNDSEQVSQEYFAGGRFWARTWNLYFIYPPIDLSTKALILVSVLEVKALLREINDKLGLQLEFPQRSVEPGFQLTFSKADPWRPRFLGCCTSRDNMVSMDQTIPNRDFREDGEFAPLPASNDRSLHAFKVKMEAAIQAGKNKSKASKEKKKFERIQLKMSWCRQLKRVQCYLGIRPRRSAIEKNDYVQNPDLEWKDQLAALEAQANACSTPLSHLDPSHSVTYPFDQDVVFVCVDVESFERDHRLITEIGISTLDTRDLSTLPPGEGGIKWMSKIRARHFRIEEYKHLVNRDFIHGCADRFEKDFGTSEFISIAEAPQIVASCFRPPFSAPHALDTTPSSPDNPAANELAPNPGNLSAPLSSTFVGDEENAEKRNIVLVGHDTKTDIGCLRDMGYEVNNLPNLLESIDTTELFRVLKHEQQSSSLGSVLLDLDLTGWNLHNAGNDAAYTLQAMIGIAFKALAEKLDRKSVEADRAARVENAIKDVQQRVMDEGEEWAVAYEEGSDGGAPLKMLSNEPTESGSKKAKVRGKSNGSLKAAHQEPRPQQQQDEHQDPAQQEEHHTSVPSPTSLLDLPNPSNPLESATTAPNSKARRAAAQAAERKAQEEEAARQVAVTDARQLSEQILVVTDTEAEDGGVSLE